MSRILPIKKPLDDRFINETDVITESALTQVIENQGGGGDLRILRLNKIYQEVESALPHPNVYPAADVCREMEISPQELDNIFDGYYDFIIDPDQTTLKFLQHNVNMHWISISNGVLVKQSNGDEDATYRTWYD